MTGTSKDNPGKRFASGLASGVSSALLLQPLDLLKTRVQQERSSSALSWLRAITRQHGAVITLWRGTSASVLRTGFGSAVYFTSLDFIRHLFPPGLSDSSHQAVAALSRSRHSNAANLVGGAAARTFAGLVTMPLTVVKVRLESSFYSYRSLPGALRAIYSTEGFAGFFSGFGATASRDAPYAGLYVLFYELFRGRLGLLAYAGGDYRLPASVAAAVNFTGGVLAGVTCAVITNPFDAVKTRLQLQPGKYRNMLQATRAIVSEEGAHQLFSGLVLRIARKALSSALAWTLYEELLRRADGTWRLDRWRLDSSRG